MRPNNSDEAPFGHDIAALAEQLESQLSETGRKVWATSGGVNVHLPGSPVMTMFEALGDQYFGLYFYCRTYSADWVGERTDLHDVASVVLAATLRMRTGVTSRLVDVFNPAVTVPSEIYGRYVVPVQPKLSVFHGEDLLDGARDILDSVLIGEVLLHDLGMFSHGAEAQGFHWDSPARMAWLEAVRIGLDLEATEVRDSVCYHRTDPAWLYYRSESLGISVIESRYLGAFMRTAIGRVTPNLQRVQAVEGWLERWDGTETTISFDSFNGVTDIMRAIEQERTPALLPPQPCFMPLENVLLAAVGDLVLIMTDETGQRASDAELDRLTQRHDDISDFLYGHTAFDWILPTDPARFEELVLALLNRERGVLARSSGPTFDRDGGRDLLIEIASLPEDGVAENVSPLNRLRMVGQCKTKRDGGSVGIAASYGMLEAMAEFQADGFFLAVSSRLSSSLVQRLDRLREQGDYFVDWWSHVEIEDRLRRNPDIAKRFQDVVARGVTR
jgi:hypothetical protein